MPSPWKDPRTGMYHVRRKVPDRLRESIGKSWWKETLGTKDANEAKRLFPDKWAECERDFELARAKIAARSFELTTRHAQGLAAEWLKGRIEGQRETPDHLEIEEAQMEIHEATEGEGDRSRWLTEAEKVATDKGLPINPEAEAMRTLAYELMWAEHEFWRMMKIRMLMTELPDPVKGVELQAVDASPRLQEIYERKINEEKTEGRRKTDFKRAIERFIEVNGDLPIAEITPTHVVKLKDSFVANGLAKNTIDKRLSDLSSVLAYASDNHLIPSNPARGIRSRGSKKSENPRLSFSPDNLEAIFSGPVYIEGKRPDAGQGEASFWLPLISLYSGARLAEIGQLTTRDIGESNGVHYFTINRDDGKKAKNDNSVRRVPIHQRLIDLGFLKYVASMDGHLFPGLEWYLNKDGERQQFAKTWGQWFGRYKSSRGITGNKNFHSFRHTFIDSCQEAAIDGDLWRKITGHAPQDVGGGYGSSDLLRRLKIEIDKVDYGDALKGVPDPSFRLSESLPTSGGTKKGARG